MAALRACAERDTARLTQWGQADLLEDAVPRERDYVKRRCGLNATRALLAERGAASLIFTGPLAKDDPRWLELLEKDAQACGYPHAQPGEVGDDLAALLGESGAAGVPLLTPLAPDLLAEAFAVSVLVVGADWHFQRWKRWCNAPHRMAGANSCAPPWISMAWASWRLWKPG